MPLQSINRKTIRSSSSSSSFLETLQTSAKLGTLPYSHLPKILTVRCSLVHTQDTRWSNLCRDAVGLWTQLSEFAYDVGELIFIIIF